MTKEFRSTKFKWATVVMVFLALAMSAQADWIAGIPGGIPIVAVSKNVKTDYGAVGDGVTDDYASISNAVKNTPVGTALLFPAGDYRSSKEIRVTRGIVLRGTNAALTKISCYDTDGSHFGAVKFEGVSGGSDYTMSSGMTAGSSNIVLATVAGLAVGDFVTIQHVSTNNPSVVRGTIPSQTGSYQGQMCQIYGISGTTVTIDEPLRETYSAAYSMRFRQTPLLLTNAGIENLTITMPGTLPHTVFFFLTARCWVKGVDSTNAYLTHGVFDRSFRNEVRYSSFHHQRTEIYESSYGFQLEDLATGCLVEDNTIYDVSGGILIQDGAQGNVATYNFIPNGYTKETPDNVLAYSILLHGGNPHGNLIEGNLAPRVAVDNFWGSGINNTFYRNRVTRYSTNAAGVAKTIQLYAMELDTYCWTNSVIGNVFCRTNDIGETFTDNKSVYLMGLDRSNTGATTNIENTVTNTTILDGNFDYPSDTTHWASGRHVLADSLFYASKPACFGDLTWPPYGPGVTDGVPVIETLPAQVRFGGGQAPAQAPTISVVANQTIMMDTATAALAFTVGDFVDPASSLTVGVTSSNHTLADDADCVLAGSGASRTVTITPNASQTGVTTITLIVTNLSLLTATNSFTVTVKTPSITTSGNVKRKGKFSIQ